jgi:hypothetical protein
MFLLEQGTAERLAESERVRVDAIHGLHYLVRNASLEDRVLEAIGRVGVRTVRSDRSRDARIAAAQLLGEFEEVEALEALMSALDDADFGVVYHAEASLVRLTGQDLPRRKGAWRDWLASVEDPFAGSRSRGGSEASEGWWTRMGAAFTGSREGEDSKDGEASR